MRSCGGGKEGGSQSEILPLPLKPKTNRKDSCPSGLATAALCGKGVKEWIIYRPWGSQG